MQYFMFCALGTLTKILTRGYLTFYTKWRFDFIFFSLSSILGLLALSLSHLNFSLIPHRSHHHHQQHHHHHPPKQQQQNQNLTNKNIIYGLLILLNPFILVSFHYTDTAKMAMVATTAAPPQAY